MGASGPPSSEDVGVSSLGCLLWALGAWGDSRNSAATHWLGGAVIVWESQPMMTEPPRGGLRFPATSACSSQAIQGRGHCAAAMWAARATPPHHVQCKWALGSSFQSAADWAVTPGSGSTQWPLQGCPGRTPLGGSRPHRQAQPGLAAPVLVCHRAATQRLGGPET